jgi:outer membrane protein W
MSSAGSVSDVRMPTLGQRLAEAQFPQALKDLNSDGRGALLQTFKASDISLKSSLTIGGKAGYFFTEEKLPWLGIELEAFRTSPKIKAQTLSTVHDIAYQPNTPATAAQCLPPVPFPNCPASALNRSSLALQESSLRVVTIAFNVVARYPGSTVQPYVGVGGAAMYFSSSGGSVQGRQWYPGLNLQAGTKLKVTEEWGLFAEGKYNLANVSNFDPTFGLSGMYSIFHLVGGIAYHF